MKYILYIGLSIMTLVVGFAAVNYVNAVEFDVRGVDRSGDMLNLVNTNLHDIDVKSVQLNGRNDCVFHVLEPARGLYAEQFPAQVAANLPDDQKGTLRFSPKATLKTGDAIPIYLPYSPCHGTAIIRIDVNTDQGVIDLYPLIPYLPGRDF